MTNVLSLKFKVLWYIDFLIRSVPSEHFKLRHHNGSFVCLKDGLQKDVIFEGSPNDGQILIPNAKPVTMTIAILNGVGYFHKYGEVDTCNITLMDILKWDKTPYNSDLKGSDIDMKCISDQYDDKKVIPYDINKECPAIYAVFTNK